MGILWLTEGGATGNGRVKQVALKDEPCSEEAGPW